MEGVEHEKIPKGRGFLYVHDNQLYTASEDQERHVVSEVLLMILSHCDGSTFCMLFF